MVTANRPAPNIEPRFARIEIIETIALVHLGAGLVGQLAGMTSRASDVFTLLKLDGEWKITHKLFHWHTDLDFISELQTPERGSKPAR